MPSEDMYKLRALSRRRWFTRFKSRRRPCPGHTGPDYISPTPMATESAPRPRDATTSGTQRTCSTEVPDLHRPLENMEGSPLHRLPSEIIVGIVDLLEKKDGLSLRATSKFLNGAITGEWRYFRTWKVAFGVVPPPGIDFGILDYYNVRHPLPICSRCREIGLRVNITRTQAHVSNVRALPGQLARLLVLHREFPTTPILASVTDFVIQFHRNWEHYGPYDYSRWDGEFLQNTKLGMVEAMSAMPRLRTVRILCYARADGLSYFQEVATFYGMLCRYCLRNDIAIHATIKVERGHLYWSHVPAFLELWVGLSSLALSLPTLNCDGGRLEGIALDAVEGGLIKLLDNSYISESSRDVRGALRFEPLRTRCHFGPRQDNWIKKNMGRDSAFLEPYEGMKEI